MVNDSMMSFGLDEVNVEWFLRLYLYIYIFIRDTSLDLLFENTPKK